jgi:hypothetical protein
MGEESDWKEFPKPALQCIAFCDVNSMLQEMWGMGVRIQDISVMHEGSFNNEKY